MVYSYSLTAIRNIATQSIKQRIAFAAAQADPTDHEEGYTTQLDVLMKWAYIKIKDQGDQKKSKPMDG